MKRWIRLYVFTGVMVGMATLVNAQSGPAPNVLEPFETLKGQSPLSVFIAIDGDRFLFRRAQDDPQLSASGFRAQIETQLRKNGITVLPPGPAKYPALQLRINSEVATGFNVVPALVYTMDLEYLQLLPIRSPGVGSPQFAEARTWRSGRYGIIPTDYVVTALPKQIGGLIEEFITAHTKANLASIMKQSPGQPGGVPLSKSEIGGLVWRGFVLGDGSGYVTFGNLYDVSASQRAMVEKQINDLRDKNQQVISCTYGGGFFYSFWFKSPPANLRELLDSVPEGKHPLRGLFFASAETCPASKELADKLLRTGRIR